MILIVDDRPENIFSLKTTLESHGYKTDTAESGEEALRKVLKTNYSLIILDIQMPVMDGFEVAETLTGFAKTKDVPIIFLSALNKDKSFITKGYTAGGIDYLTKPVDTDILLLKVKTFYRLSEQKQQLARIHKSLEKEIEIRKLAEAQLDGRVKELHVILEMLSQIAFTLNTNGDVDFVNEHWNAYSTDPTVYPEVYPEDKGIYEAWKNAFAEGNAYTGEIRIKNIQTGEFRYFLLKINPVKQDNSILKWVGTFTDIQEQKKANEILEQNVLSRTQELVLKNKELEAKNNELQQFAWVASHDLKEPLRKIQTYSYMVKDSIKEDKENITPLLDGTIKSAERMGLLINDLLEYSRLSAVALFKPTSLNDITTEVIADLEYSIQQKKAKIHVGPLPQVEAIKTQIRQVFQNLISNGLKFSKEGQAPVINITAELVSEKRIDSATNVKGPFCRIIVSDNGIGFNEKYLDKIFVIFQRLHGTETFEGTGIGLAIAKKIIDKHNGLISAQSTLNEGASFIIILPLHQDGLQH